MRKAIITLISAVAFGAAGQAMAAGGVEIPKRDWSFEGVFGTYDRASAQRGLQVYKEVCAGCHSLNYLYYRNLMDLGYSEAAVKAFAAEHEAQDGPNDEGEMFMRPALPSDRVVKPFPNAQAARASNGGALPPDLTLIAEARVGGPNYINALLTGYTDPPADVEVSDGMHYNAYFAGHQIAMAAPLFEGAVQYSDGTKATVEQMAADVTTFLTWASEPNMEERKAMGFNVMLFLVVFCGLLIAVKRKVWSNVH
ncbi:MAG: cytochrome c1 [Proteobacteria bacterium]|nr:cytochrome c1 [Pseudomonadota bacterium]